MLRIKEIAKSKGYKLSEVADKLNIGRSAFHQMTTGNPTVETLEKIASALNVEVWELFTPTTNKEELTALVDHQGKLYKANTIEDLQKIIDEIRQ
ncbi:XRE family transcriptional regulator [Dysgonomonas capnocytophagoides]|uniref:XRE family transcriptional regulator n=1 Tax=Dysgonomonas capnocytophagoides TaxID=45254 RepID=A0A4Y8L035_9BACT|nr:helix-turn-helix transcriptional regulator [Dysgonomonas capnocytophagoides]TFD95524.1 XRE family transcriptional regulator [Dysgonomonas capnocytophagoides]